MKSINLIFFFLSFFSCVDEKVKITYETKFQKDLNIFFKDATTSPLKISDLKKFKSLPFFPLDSSFIVLAKFQRTPESEFFEMETSTNKKTKERVYGILTFEIMELEYQLKVYQNQLSAQENKNDLLLPFIDNTNGFSTYGGGRYINLDIPKTNKLIIDFNKSYNPYCAYNDRYSCPLVPKDNYLPIDVKAGVKYKLDY
tara:strand:+ start:989 stop:1585 length:597 start_codon:yes stop_codon:yes gene_type:complete